MHCRSCGRDNPSEASFCMQCGAKLEPVCTRCGQSNPPEAAHCIGCGHSLTAATSAPAQATGPALPASFASGRYQVRRFLAEGAKKRVFEAHDTLLDRDVAVALIKTEGLDTLGRQRVTQEAQALGRLGAHPNIVSVFDLGEHPSASSGQAGQPFMVTELLPSDVAAALRDAGGPLPLEQTLQIAKDACRGLEFAHAQNVVHRDLKPGNVLLTAEGTAKIGDFGLAVSLDRSRLTQQGMIVGTVAYMPPEQALGGEVTPRADLYAFGAMLYEMITGRPPFVSDNPTAVISQHINTPPVAPSWHSEACPQDLEEIVLRLLAKDPAERFASADDVLAALERVDPGQKSASHSDSNVLDRLALGVFVGREQELERLRQAFDNAVSGHGGLVMLVGEPGIGKTRTVQELETYAKMRGAQVLWGRTHESAGAPAYWPWLQAGNQWAAAHIDQLQALLGPHLPPGSISELSRIFPWFRQAVNFVEPEEVSDPEVAQFRLFDAYASYLKAIANQAPLVIALDDLHWADKPTLLMLQHIARELSRMRVLIVANYRDTDITRQSALSETLALLNRESGFDRIVMRGLSRDEVEAYIKARANVEPRRDVLDRIFEETEGNAFFLSEVVNLMAQEGTLTKTSTSDIAIPDGVREALGRRLNRLSEGTNELLQVAAIIGRDFTYDTLTLLGDRDEDALLRMIEEALEARVIEETEQAGRYRFTHAQMQETLLAELSTTRRVRLHGRVGEALEQRYGARADERAARLALHFAEAATLAPRFTEKAARYATIAGRQALEQSAYPEAVRHFRAALSAREGQEIDDEMAELLTNMGRACEVTLRHNEGWRAYRQAFDHYVQRGNVARAVDVAEHIGLSTIFARLTQTQMVERALELVDEGSAEYGRLNVALGHSAGMLADDARAQEAFARAREVARHLGLKRLELTGLAAEMQVDVIHWRPAQYLAKAKSVIELAAELNEPETERHAHNFAAFNCDLARREEARAHADAGMALAERLRLPAAIASAAEGQTAVAAGAGDWAAARAAANRGLEMNPYDNWLLPLMAEVERQQGDFKASAEFAKRLVAAMDDLALGVPYRVASSSQVPLNTALQGYVTGQPVDGSLIQRASQVVLSLPRPPGFFGGLVHAGLGLQAALIDDREAAEEELEQLAPYANKWVIGLTFDHIRGLLFETLGQVEEAIEAIETTLAYPQTGYGLRPYWSWAAYDCARIRLKRDATGDRERARALIDEALGHAQKLGMKPLVDRIVALKLQDQGISTTGDIYTSIDAVTDSVQSERPDISVHAAPDGMITLMFSDIEDSTPLAERLGDEAWVELLREHNAMIREQIAACDGHEVKTIGDAFMVAFQSPAKALRCAVAIQSAFASYNREHPQQLLRVRIGLHTGEAVRDAGDFYGTNVILASRIANEARGGEILVSSMFRQLVDSALETSFGNVREVALKGLSGRHHIQTVEWSRHAL